MDVELMYGILENNQPLAAAEARPGARVLLLRGVGLPMGVVRIVGSFLDADNNAIVRVQSDNAGGEEVITLGRNSANVFRVPLEF